MAQAFDGSTIQTTVGQPTVRPPARARLQALAAYVKRNQSFLGRVLRQYAWNTVNVRLLERTREQAHVHRVPGVLPEHAPKERLVALDVGGERLQPRARGRSNRGLANRGLDG